MERIYRFITCAGEFDEAVDAISFALVQVVERDLDNLDAVINRTNTRILDSMLPPNVMELREYDVETRLAEVRISHREVNHMNAEDCDIVATMPPKRSPILVEYYKFEALVRGTANEWIARGRNPNHVEELVEAEMDEWLSENDVTSHDIYRLQEAYATKFLIYAADQSIPTLGQRGEQHGRGSLEGASSIAEHNAIVASLDELPLPNLIKFFPELAGALVQDARARWGILERTNANYQMVGHHMRKMCRNSSLKVCAVDAHVGPALNQFFLPNGSDIIARGQLLGDRAVEQWNRYDRVGLSWWAKLFLSNRAPVARLV